LRVRGESSVEILIREKSSPAFTGIKKKRNFSLKAKKERARMALQFELREGKRK